MSAWELRVAPAAERALARLPQRVATAVAEFIVGPLLDDPQRVGKPLQRELAGHFSARRGSYRIVYAIDEDERAVLVLRIEHRADVYRRR